MTVDGKSDQRHLKASRFLFLSHFLNYFRFVVLFFVNEDGHGVSAVLSEFPLRAEMSPCAFSVVRVAYLQPVITEVDGSNVAAPHIAEAYPDAKDFVRIAKDVALFRKASDRVTATKKLVLFPFSYLSLLSSFICLAHERYLP